MPKLGAQQAVRYNSISLKLPNIYRDLLLLLGLVPESLDKLLNLKVLKLSDNNFEGGFEDEVWHLPVKDQLLYWGMVEGNLADIAVDAARHGRQKTLKYIAMNEKPEVILRQCANGESVLEVLVKVQALLTYQMLSSLPVVKSQELMYRRYAPEVKGDGFITTDTIGESFCYPLPDGEYCIRGSTKKEHESFWFGKVEGQENATYFAYLTSVFKSWLGSIICRADNAPVDIIALVYERAESKFPVVSYTLPFEYMSCYAYLKVYVDLVDQTGQFELFDNENIKLAVTAAWESYGQAYHIGLCLVYMLYLALLSYSNFAYQTGVDCVAILVIVLALNSTFTFIELYQLYMFGLFKYLSDYQNVLEISACALVFAGTIARLSVGDDTTSTEELMAVASVLVWFNALNLLRPFKQTGSLIMMVSKVTTRIIPFILILMIVIYGFSQALYLLANNYHDTGYTSMQRAYILAFASITGSGVNVGVDVGDKTDMMLVIESLFTGFTQILLLNLLIAFLAYVYAGIQEQADAVGSYERCKIIMSQVRPWGAPKGDKWIHFLKKETDVAKDKNKQVDKESTNIKIDDLKKDLAELECRILQELSDKLDASEKRVLAKVDSIGKAFSVAQSRHGNAFSFSDTLGPPLDDTCDGLHSTNSSIVELELKSMPSKVDKEQKEQRYVYN